MARFFSEEETTTLLVDLSANSALLTDTYTSSLRAQRGAAKRGR
jgi:hypothetical protein